MENDLESFIGKARMQVIALDLFGYAYNKKYPPNIALYGDDCQGYKTWNQSLFFYDFAVHGYDMWFTYKGKKYFLMANGDNYCTCKDEHFTPSEESIFFDNGNDLIEHLLIEGRPLIEIIDELEDVEIL